MATLTVTRLVEEMDGFDAVETISFEIDTAQYEIDLSQENGAKLRDKLAKFIEVAKPVKASKAKKITKRAITIPSSKEQTAAVRAWANQNGFTVSERGRIPKNVLEAFNEVTEQLRSEVD